MSIKAAFAHLSTALPDDEEIADWLAVYFPPGAALSIFGGHDSGQINDDELPAVMVGEGPAELTPGTLCTLDAAVELVLRVIWKEPAPAIGFDALLSLFDILPRAIMRNRTMGDSVNDSWIRNVQRDASEQPTYIVRADLRLNYELRTET